MKLITPEELSERLKIPVKSLAPLERRDSTFPRAIRVSKRTLRWDEDEIEAWLETKKLESANEDEGTS